MIASDVSHNLVFTRRQIRCFWKQTDFEGWVNYWAHCQWHWLNTSIPDFCWFQFPRAMSYSVCLTHIVKINWIPDENSLSCHIKNYWKREEYFVYSLMQNLDRKCTKNSVMVSDASGICTLFLPSLPVFEEKEKNKKNRVLGENKTSLWALFLLIRGKGKERGDCATSECLCYSEIKRPCRPNPG